MAASSRAAYLLQQYFHVALPRDVPGKLDRNLFGVESALLERFIDAVKIVTPLAPLEHQQRLDLVRLALTTSRALNVEGKVDKNILATELRQLRCDQVLVIHVTEQNCALFIYKLPG
jgi:F420-0:gamma-glutamyl ligase-like protein